MLREVLGGAVAILRPQAEAKGLESSLVVDPRLPHVCRGLPLQLRQVLMNLLANAIEFTPRGHVSVTATLAEREPRAGAAAARRARRGHRRVPPPRASASSASSPRPTSRVPDRYGGTGLGLAIAEAAGRADGRHHRARATARAALTVEIPLACDEDAAARPPDLMGRRVAIVTPDRELARPLQTWLTAWRAETQWYVERRGRAHRARRRARRAPRPADRRAAAIRSAG